MNRTDERLTALEIKTSFQDEMIDKLDQVIIRQQEQIDALTREVVHLRNQPADVGSGALRNAHDDLPPHY